MCGIVGVVNYSGKWLTGMEKTIKELLFMDTIRGADATGVYAFDKDLKTHLYKECVDGWTFINRKPAENILRVAEEHPFILGHNRAATIGSHKDPAYAHPIVVDERIALAHNGTLNSWPGRYRQNRPLTHDSTAIAHIIAEGGPQEFVDSCVGAYSLVWHNMVDNTFNFLRNEDRPMAMVHTNENCMFFGSELGMVMWIIQRNGFHPKSHQYTQPHKLYTFELGVAEPQVTEVKKTFRPVVSAGRFPENDYPQGPFTPFRGPAQGREEPALFRAGSRRTRGGPNYGFDGIEGLGTEWDRDEERRVREGNNSTGTDESKFSTQQKGEKEGEDKAKTRGKTVENDETKQTKPHGTAVNQYKSFRVGDQLIFSIEDYSDVRETSNGAMYTITGSTRPDFPEIQVRTHVKPEALPQETIQKTDKYLWGTATSIFATTNGNIIIFVKDIEISNIKDPSQERLNKHKGMAEAVVIALHPHKNPGVKDFLPPSKEICQGCNDFFTKDKLRLVEEASVDSHGNNEITRTFRFCEGCVETYAEQRDKVVPAKVRGRFPRRTAIRLFEKVA